MKKFEITVLIFIMAFTLGACYGGTTTQNNEKKDLETGFIVAEPGMYDSVDQAVIVDIQNQRNKIVFYNMVVKRNYTLNYDGACKITDKYGENISIDQLSNGEVVHIQFLKDKKQLASIQKSAEAVVYENMSRFVIDEDKKEIAVAENLYQFDENLLIFSDQKKVELMDLNEADKLTITTLDTQVLSIRVEKGHGYLRLKNETALIGGWIEVGQNIIHKITEGMMLVVPEGKYDVVFSKGSLMEKRKVEIKRDRETELDLKDFVTEEKKEYGNIIFVVNPKDAEVYVDGEFVDLSSPYQLEYGIHQLLAKAEGYQTIIQYIKVGQKNATIDVSLQEQREETVSGNSTNSTVSGNAPLVSTGGMLTITAPDGAELYMDGNYVGVVPCTVRKTEGIHVIVLRRSGYETRSYTIQLENGKTDQSMSFSELIKSKEDSKGKNSMDTEDGNKIEEDKKEEKAEQKKSVSGNEG